MILPEQIALPSIEELATREGGLPRLLLDIEHAYLIAALQRTGGDQMRAAGWAGMSYRAFRYREYHHRILVPRDHAAETVLPDEP